MRRRDGKKWKPDCMCLNGDTAEKDNGRPLQTNEFIVYFPADAEYWRLHEHRHKRKFTISARAGLVASVDHK
jgi:hypothetical protein